MAKPITLSYLSRKARSDNSILYDFDGQEEWIPISQIEDDSNDPEDPDLDGESGDVEIPLWLAKDRGLD